MDEKTRDGLRLFLDAVQRHKLAAGHLRAILVIAVGGRIEFEGQTLSQGTTWRDLADLLKKLRWDKLQVGELGLNVKDLPPRDRGKYWYSAMSRADLGSGESSKAAAKLLPALEKIGFKIALPHAS